MYLVVLKKIQNKKPANLHGGQDLQLKYEKRVYLDSPRLDVVAVDGFAPPTHGLVPAALCLLSYTAYRYRVLTIRTVSSRCRWQGAKLTSTFVLSL